MCIDNKLPDDFNCCSKLKVNQIGKIFINQELQLIDENGNVYNAKIIPIKTILNKKNKYARRNKFRRG